MNEKLAKLHAELDLPPLESHLDEGTPPIPVDEQLLRDLHAGKLEGDKREGVLSLIANYRAWYDADTKLRIERALREAEGDRREPKSDDYADHEDNHPQVRQSPTGVPVGKLLALSLAAAICFVAIGLAVRYFQQDPTNAHAGESLRQMKTIGEASVQFRRDNDGLPPRAITDESGIPLLSWRVALLPYLGSDGKELHERFHLDEPWDSEHNRTLVEKMPGVFAASEHGVQGNTRYLVPVGEDCLYPTNGVAARSIPRGLGKTIFAVKVGPLYEVVWTRPADFSYDPSAPTRSLPDSESAPRLVIMADGSAKVLRTDVDAQSVRELFDPDGNKNALKDQAVFRDI